MKHETWESADVNNLKGAHAKSRFKSLVLIVEAAGRDLCSCDKQNHRHKESFHLGE